jgi:hypothetical protein
MKIKDEMRSGVDDKKERRWKGLEVRWIPFLV